MIETIFFIIFCFLIVISLHLQAKKYQPAYDTIINNEKRINEINIALKKWSAQIQKNTVKIDMISDIIINEIDRSCFINQGVKNENNKIK